MWRAISIICALAGVSLGLTAAPALAASPPPPPDVAIPMYPATARNVVPPAFTIDPAEALAVAETSREMLSIHRSHHPLQYEVYVWVRSHYEIYFYFHDKVIADQIVWPTGKLGPTFTGPLIAAAYARGDYGGIFDVPWVFAPFTLLFLLPLAFLRRARWLDVLDIAAVLGFGVSYVLFDTKHLELGVWLAYPPLLYLLARMLRRGWRGRAPARNLDCRLPTGVLVGGLLLLIAARIALTLQPAAVLDVGTASALGAYRILHGQSLYFFSLGHPDTYGPIAYLAYVPFMAIFHGSWFYLPGARAATITFDLLTIGGLVLVGVRLRKGREGRRLGLLLAWLWAACPFSLLGIVKSTNDGLVSLLVVLMMLSLNGPVRRGVLVGLGAAAKFSPAVLLPLMAAGHGSARRARAVVLAFMVTVSASVALFLPPGGLQEFYQHTIGYQLTRTDVFSIWALHPALAPIKLAIELAVLGLAVAVFFRPRGPRTPAQVSALAAALMVAVQLPAVHWFYLYIVWFLPLVLIAVLGIERPAGAESMPAPGVETVPSRQREPELAGAV